MRKLCLLLLALAVPLCASDPLPSWNEGIAKNAIMEFVRETCDSASSKFVKPENRIATFDQDGTLWVEHPLYTQGVFALDRVKILAAQHPEWENQEPFKSIITGDLAAISKFKEEDWARIIAVTHTGMSTERFLEIAKQWLMQAKHPRFDKLYTELIYQPMLEVMDYLRSNSFKTYIVTGGGQEFVRVFSQQVYGITPEQVLGSSVSLKYEQRDNFPILFRLPHLFFICNNSGKSVGIEVFIGKRPYAAFGNSDGDKEMLEWTQGADKPRLMMLVLHDDPVREYAYGPAGGLPNTDVGTFSEALMNQALRKDWIVISMKKDWKTIFSFKSALN